MFHDVPLTSRSDMCKLVKPRHQVDEEVTGRRHARIQDAIGDILPVVVDRTPAWVNFHADISTDLARLVGLEQTMMLMCEDPEWLHELLGFMRDSVIAVQDAAEAAGDFNLHSGGWNQAMTPAGELPAAAPTGGARCSDLWGYCAAQEYTGVSPAMHEKFLLDYQLPIISRYGLVAYGCCEDLTRKITMLRRIPNLRRIAVTPVADVGRCAQQINQDYVMSWRPNPAMVCCGFDEGHIRSVIAAGLEKTRDCFVDITLKDVQTVQKEPERIGKWVGIVRSELDKSMAQR